MGPENKIITWKFITIFHFNEENHDNKHFLMYERL